MQKYFLANRYSLHLFTTAACFVTLIGSNASLANDYKSRSLGLVNGICGSSNGKTLFSDPTTNLCASGTASAVTGSGPWKWSCEGIKGGSTVSCSASLQDLNGMCGSANGQSVASAPTNDLCSTGTASTVTGSGPWDWTCTGNTANSSVSCLANLAGQGSSSAGLSAPAGYTSSELIFDDKFNSATLNSASWNPWMGNKQYGRWGNNGQLPNPYSSVGNAGGYNAEYEDPYPAGYSTSINGDHLVTGSGLRLIATPSSHFSGYTWAGSTICSEGKISVPATGGYVQFEAKMPDSRYGAWGALWFLDGVTSAGSSEIDLIESGYSSGSTNPNQIMAMNLHTTGNSQIKMNTGVDLSAAYHVYGVEYNPGNWVKMYLDGKLEATYTSNVPTGTYEIIIAMTMAQGSSGWHPVSDISTNPGPFEMDVSEVQVYSLAP